MYKYDSGITEFCNDMRTHHRRGDEIEPGILSIGHTANKNLSDLEFNTIIGKYTLNK